MPTLRPMLSWRRLLALTVVAVLAGAPIACSEWAGSPSSRVECHKSKGNPEC